MKVFKKNVYIGSLVLGENTTTTNKATGKQEKVVNSAKIERNVLFVKTKEDTFVKLEELKKCGLPSGLARKFVTQFKLKPETKADSFVKNLKPYYKNDTYKESERIDLRDVCSSGRTL